MQLRKWVDGVYSEIAFWTVWTRYKVTFQPRDYRRRLLADQPFDELVTGLLPDLPADQIRVLDVGSGPFSGLGVMHKGAHLDISAADPLAPAYHDIFARFKLTPPIPVQMAFAEDLAAFYPLHHFHVVVCQNALDHCIEPWRALRQMIEITRPGGHVFLRHTRNEAERQDYGGLHQWNLDRNASGEFVIWNREASHNVSRLLAGIASVQVLPSKEQDVIVTIRKDTDSALFSPDDYRARLKEVLVGVSDVANNLGRDTLPLRAYYTLRTYGQYVLGKVGNTLRGRSRRPPA